MDPLAGPDRTAIEKLAQAQRHQIVSGRVDQQLGRATVPGAGGHALFAGKNLGHGAFLTPEVGQTVQGKQPGHQVPG